MISPFKSKDGNLKVNLEKSFISIQYPASIKDLAYQNIKKQIIQGYFKPGIWLREQDIANAMQVSRAPVREAFNQLERDGFVEIIPRKGTKVISLSEKEVEDIFEIRGNLEVLALKKSLRFLPLKQLKDIAKKFKQFNYQAVEKTNRNKYLILDKEFHDFLINGCNNQMLIRLLSSIQEKVHWLRGFSLDSHSFLQSIGEHLSIIQAIFENNEDVVRINLLAHLERAKESIIKDIKNGKFL